MANKITSDIALHYVVVGLLLFYGLGLLLSIILYGLGKAYEYFFE